MIYERIAGTGGKKIGVWPLLNDIWQQSEGLLTWAQVKERHTLSTPEFQELKRWFQALHQMNSNTSRQRTRSLAHQLLIAIERNDGVRDPETGDITEHYRLTEQQVLDYLGL